MSAFEQRLSFRIFYFMENDHKIIVKCRRRSWGVVSSATGSWRSPGGVQKVKPLKILTFIHLEDKWIAKKPSKRIHFKCKLNVHMLWSKNLWRLSLKTQLEHWAFCAVYRKSKLFGWIREHNNLTVSQTFIPKNCFTIALT